MRSQEQPPPPPRLQHLDGHHQDYIASKPAMMNKPSSQAKIIKQEYERFKDGSYRFYYEQSDGQSREEVGYFRNDPKLGKVLTVHGSYGYIAPNKKKIFVKYSSDDRGFMSQHMLSYAPVGLPSNVINQHLNGLKQ
jgi:hypothetical protein